MLRVRGRDRRNRRNASKKHPDFVAIEEAISNAPSNGVETIVSIGGRSIPWVAQIVIPKGKNIVLNGINTKMQVGLDAGGTTRHFYVEEGASLSAINVAFKNERGIYGGAIESYGTIARLDMLCLMETLRRNLAVLFACAEAAVASKRDRMHISWE